MGVLLQELRSELEGNIGTNLHFDILKVRMTKF